MSDVYMDEEVEKAGKPRSRGSTLLKDHYSTDRVLLEQLWSTDGTVHFDRAQTVKSFSDVDIIEFSQYPQGRWKNNSDIKNKVITSRFYYHGKHIYKHWRGRITRFKITKIPAYLSRSLRR